MELIHLTSVQSPDVGWNCLTGTMPDECGTLLAPNLHDFEVNHNHLTGTTPNSLILNGTEMRRLNPSHDLFSGRMPLKEMFPK